MAGIYIHIPFCRQKCHYCNFYSLASKKHAEEFVLALIKEIAFQQHYLEGEEVQSVYFGGGTPSLLSIDSIQKIEVALKNYYNIKHDAEITLEANPDDVSALYLQQLKNTFINRLSMGVQSFFDDDLHFLNRVHAAADAKNAIKMAQDAGFDKLTIDLIYGIPGLTDAKWKANVDYFLKTGIKHLSAYALTVEARTALAQFIQKGKMPPVDELQSVRQFEYLMQQMEEAGFVHYEISNFAMPGHYSRHNSLYWAGGNYLGLGPSAHSYNGHTRQWNVANLKQYIQMAGITETLAEKEVLTLEQRYDEYVMTSLRTSWGCDLVHIQNAFGKKYSDYCLQQASKYVQSGKLEMRNNSLFLTQSGKHFADGIASDLFLV